MCFCDNEECPYHDLEYTPGLNKISVFKAVIPGYSTDFYRINLERYKEKEGLFLCSVCHKAVRMTAIAAHTSIVRGRP